MTNEPQTYLTWDDSGIYVQCDRDECKVTHPNGVTYWWTSGLLPYRLTAEEAVAAVAEHVATHNPEQP